MIIEELIWFFHRQIFNRFSDTHRKYCLLLSSVPTRVFAKVFTILMSRVVSRNDEAATPINTWPVVNVSRAPGLCLFIVSSFLSCLPLFFLLFVRKFLPKTGTTETTPLLLRPLGCLTRSVALDPLNELLLFIERRFFHRYARFFLFSRKTISLTASPSFYISAFRCHSLIHYHTGRP